jgi:hypothetical protein
MAQAIPRLRQAEALQARFAIPLIRPSLTRGPPSPARGEGGGRGASPCRVMAGPDPAIHVFPLQKRGCSGQARASRFGSVDAVLREHPEVGTYNQTI